MNGKKKFNKNITREELERAIRKVKMKSIPGLGGIDYKMIKELSEKYKKEIFAVFNALWKRGKGTKECKNYIVFFIDKKGKKKVRPISLSSCWEKIMEKIINERFNW